MLRGVVCHSGLPIGGGVPRRGAAMLGISLPRHVLRHQCFLQQQTNDLLHFPKDAIISLMSVEEMERILSLRRELADVRTLPGGLPSIRFEKRVSGGGSFGGAQDFPGPAQAPPAPRNLGEIMHVRSRREPSGTTNSFSPPRSSQRRWRNTTGGDVFSLSSSPMGAWEWQCREIQISCLKLLQRGRWILETSSFST